MGTEPLVMLVSGTELMGVDVIREALSEAGFKVAAIEADRLENTCRYQKPAVIVASLSDYECIDLELCQVLHRYNGAPIIAIGSGLDEAFRIGLLEWFLDDFLTRPVNARELVARVRNILRRTQAPRPSPSGTF